MLVPFTPFFWGDWWNHIATQCNPCSIALLNPVHFNACPLFCFQSYMFEPHPQKWSGWTLSWLSILSKIASLITCWKTHFPKKYRDSQFYKIPIMGVLFQKPFPSPKLSWLPSLQNPHHGGTVPKTLSIPLTRIMCNDSFLAWITLWKLTTLNTSKGTAWPKTEKMNFLN